MWLKSRVGVGKRGAFTINLQDTKAFHWSLEHHFGIFTESIGIINPYRASWTMKRKHTLL